MKKDNKQDYASVLKSTSIIGGSQGISMLVGFIRVKFIAILLGPIGVGLITTYQSLIGVIGTIVGLGIQESAVRDISKAVAEDDTKEIDKSISTLKRLSWTLGLIGSIFLFMLARKLSIFTFESEEYTSQIELLSIVLLFNNIKGIYRGILQGFREINKIAVLNVTSSILGAFLSTFWFIFLGLDGIAFALVTLSFCELVIAWCLARKVWNTIQQFSWRETILNSKSMVNIGLALMWNNLLIFLVAYAIRMSIADQIDLISVGIYSAAFTLSGYAINFILGAMSSDYYPKLTSVSHDKEKMRTVVKVQSEISILLALPVLIVSITLAPQIIYLLYSSEFNPAVDLFKWFILGCFFRVLSWPLGFIVLALGKSKLFALTETLANGIHLLVALVLVNYVGISGASYAFAIMYIIYFLMMTLVAFSLIEFKWEVRSILYMLISLIVIMLMIYVTEIFSGLYPILLGLMLSIGFGLYSIKQLLRNLPEDNKIVMKILKLKFIK